MPKKKAPPKRKLQNPEPNERHIRTPESERKQPKRATGKDRKNDSTSTGTDVPVEQRPLIVRICYNERNLEGFISTQKRELKELKVEYKKSNRKKPVLVALRYHGPPKCLHVPISWQLFVKQNVNASTYAFTDQSDDDSTYRLGLADTLFVPFNKAPHFFQTMMLIDPDGSTDNCGYIIMLLFFMFLKNENETEDLGILFLQDSLMKSRANRNKLIPQMRSLLTEWCVQEVDEQNILHQHDELFSTFNRHSASDETWKEQLEFIRTSLSADEMLEDTKEGPMDIKSWAVFAKRTKTRFILVSLTRGDNWEEEPENNDTFHTFEVDWRNSDADPLFKFSLGIPFFDDDFDFYRTVVLMFSPSCRSVEGNDVV